MKIVIDIPKVVYDGLKNREMLDEFVISEVRFYGLEIGKSIQNGTPLPNGHGDLKDVSKIDYQQGCFVDSTGSPLPIIHKIATIEMIRDWLPTLIEADEEGEK